MMLDSQSSGKAVISKQTVSNVQRDRGAASSPSIATTATETDTGRTTHRTNKMEGGMASYSTDEGFD
jgi:hypothetical protein